jgi:DNA-binding IclR family transcriptional regulator
MVREPQSGAEAPELQSVLDALDDADCRTIIHHLDEPMTASEVSEACDIPMSTTYRKLDLLTEASLLAESTEIRSDGHHTTRYYVDFDAVEIELTADQTLAVAVARPTRSADERLASLWSEVRKET